jgi:O-antigen ligase
MFGLLFAELVLLPDWRLPKFLLATTIVSMGFALAESQQIARVLNVGRFVAPSALVVVLLRRRLAPLSTSVGRGGRSLLIALTALAGVSFFSSGDQETTALKFCSLLIVATAIVLLLRWEKESPGRLGGSVAIAFAILVVTNSLMIAAGVPLYGVRFLGWASNPNGLGLMCALGIPVFVSVLRTSPWRLHRRAALVLTLLASVLLLLSGSRGALLGALVGIGAVVRNTRVSRSLILPGFIVTVAVVTALGIQSAPKNQLLRGIDRSGSSGREEAWTVAWEELWRRPAFGAGFATTEKRFVNKEFGTFRVFEGGQFHNSYLETGVELGVLGGLLLCLAGLRAISYVVRPVSPENYWAAGMAVTAAVAAVFETGLLTPGSILFTSFWLALGVLTIRSEPPARPVHDAPGDRTA